MRLKKFLKLSIPLALGLIFLAACSSTTSPYNAKKSLGSQVNYTITGIEAGSGTMANTQTAIKKYGLDKDNWQLQSTSTAAMIAALDKAIKHKSPIVITGWVPHWMFVKYDIKFLKDPKNVYGKSGNIDNIARLGLDKDQPGVYQFLKNFKWSKSQLSSVMMAVNNGTDPEKAAKTYVKKHPKQVKKWLKGVQNGNGQKTVLTYVAWDSATATANVVKEVLESKGYKVDIRAMDGQPMWAAVASGKADFSIAAWLPVTQAAYAKSFKGQYVDVGSNITGTQIGLAVPKYMKNINSIEDLKN